MSLIQCPDCGKKISDQAQACPECGRSLKKRRGCLRYFLIGFAIFMGLGIVINLINTGSNKSKSPVKSETSPIPPQRQTTSPSPSAKEAPEIKTYDEGEAISIGYTFYEVRRSWWSSKLSDNRYLNRKPDASFLFVELAVRNEDAKPRSIPSFKLIDYGGAEYKTSSHAWAVEGSIGILESLNPGVEKRGFIVFDVPDNIRYRLKLSGGYWSKEEALVDLDPKWHHK